MPFGGSLKRIEHLLRGVRGTALTVMLAMLMSAGGAVAQQPEPEPVPHRSVLSKVLHTLGGAVVGGWVGWMGSQVALSDWDRPDGGNLMDRRVGWVVGGAVTGVIASQFIGTTTAPGAVPVLTPGSRDRSVITREEIALSGANNAYELIQSLRGEWLRSQRGVNQWSESARGAVDETSSSITPGAPRTIVYMNTTRLGGLETLREISLFELQRIEFVGPQQATTRYGTGHEHGVIQLWTVENRSL